MLINSLFERLKVGELYNNNIVFKDYFLGMKKF